VGRNRTSRFCHTWLPVAPHKLSNSNPVFEVSAQHLLDDEPKSMEDMEYFLSAKFDEIRRTHPSKRHIPHNWPPFDVIADLVQRSSGQFIYPATIIKYISSPRHSLMLHLDIILKLWPLSGESPFAQLDALYTRYGQKWCRDTDFRTLQNIAPRLVSSIARERRRFKASYWTDMYYYS